METLEIRILIEMLDKELQKQGYALNTLRFYRTTWGRILKYFDSKEVSEYSEELLLQYLDDEHNISKKKEIGQMSQYDVSMVRVVCMIGDYHLKGAFLRKYYGKSKITNETFHRILSEFVEDCNEKGNREATIKRKCYDVSKMLEFFIDNGISELSKINSNLIDKYILTLSQYAPGTVAHRVSILRDFLKFAFKQNYVRIDFSNQLPHFPSPRNAKIPSVWKHEDVVKMLETVDRGNPSGKRDYAILMLATHLGIRIGDIKQLKFENFKWNTNRLEFVQSKTNEFISLPLLKEVGWAVIDYIQNGRPLIDNEYIFIRHCAPYGEFSKSNALKHIIDKYRKLAKLPPVEHKIGMHSLRHTLASTLLQNEVSLDVISDVLGHQNADTTDIYLKVDIESLRKCALVPLEVTFHE